MLGKYSILVNLKRKPYKVILANREGNVQIWRETPFIKMRIPNRHIKLIVLDSINIGKHNIILEVLWIRKHNPKINWENNSLQFNKYAYKANIK